MPSTKKKQGGKKVPKKKKTYNMDEEIIIGYNTKNIKDNPSQKNTKSNNNKKKKKNNKNKKSKWNKVKKVLLTILKIILLIAVIAGIGIFLFVSPVFNITNVRVENAGKISENTYIVLSGVELGQNIFRISKSRIREQIKTESYVEDVEIKREYPGTIILTVKEREAEYMLEYNGMYIYIDKNGYILEKSIDPIDAPIIKEIYTNLDNIELGQRLVEDDLSKFNDLIKIIDGMKNNSIEAKITSIDISDNSNYIIEFEETKKKVLLGDSSNLSTKMLWIKYFVENNVDGKGIIHLQNIENVYFEPERDQNS